VTKATTFRSSLPAPATGTLKISRRQKVVEGLMSALRGTCAGLPGNCRRKNGHYVIAAIGMTVFSVLFMQSPSFLARERHLAQGHGHGHSNRQMLLG
jgi:hypothetical protein